MKQWIAIMLLLAACQNENQKRETYYYSLCPPGNACLAPAFAINRLKRDIYVKFDDKKKRFVQAKSSDAQAIIVHPEGIVDFWREPVYVMATPSLPHRQVNPSEGTPTPGLAAVNSYLHRNLAPNTTP